MHNIPTTRSSVKHLPVNLFGAVMGLSGLALSWRIAHQAFGASAVIAEGIGQLAIAVFVLLTVAYGLKWRAFPDAVKAEFTHPIAGNFFGTFTISLLLVSALLSAYNTALSQIVWSLGALLTIALSVVVVARLLNGRSDSSHSVPAWLIPGVASLDIVVAGASMPMAWAHEVNLFALASGTMVALVFFVMIFARLTHHDPLPAGMTPSLMILVAPFEVGFLAYTAFTHQVDMFAAMLFYFGLFVFVVVAFKVFRLSVPFGASWWAIGFPMAALSNAALKYALMVQSGSLIAIALAILALLSVAILTLLVRTLHLLITGKLLAG
jgi:tellurite resistance protein